jgi:dihydroflavonol-4-reductase
MKVAVTGASGHIGSCLIYDLRKQGAEIRALVHNGTTHYEEGVEVVRGSLLEPGSLFKLCEGADVVFHLAAQIAIENTSSSLVYETNVTGTKNMLTAARAAGVGKFIHFSSIHAFQIGSRDKNLDESSPLVESDNIVYEFSKAEGEREVMRATAEGLNAVILNPTAVIGPFDNRNSLLGQALIKIYKNKLPFLISGGYNWVDVRDIVSASINAIGAGRSGEKYILSGTFCSLKELSGMISRLSGRKIPFVVPVALARFACPFFKFYASLTNTKPLYTYQSLDILVDSPVNISNAKAQNELGYMTRPLQDTLRDTFEWYRENNFLN